MGKLTKVVKRETDSTVFDRSQYRNLIVSIEPAKNGAVIGMRVKGTRDTYRLQVGAMFVHAINNHQAKIERNAKALVKKEGISLRSARARAKREAAQDLR